MYYQCFQTDYLKKEYFKDITNQFASITPKNSNVININSNITYQEIIGFGGAFTEAAAFVYHEASNKIKDQLIKMYFDSIEGINYQLGRVVINSCDFSLHNYTYVEENDFSLATFNMEREDQWTISMIRDAMKYSDLALMAAPWSPPAFLKTNRSMNHGGKLIPEFFNIWADYLIKYLDEMQKRGLKVEYLSIQNEPEANQVWDSCLYSPEEALSFIKVLGPKLKIKHPNTKIVFLDHNRDILVKWASALKKDKEADEYIWGFGIHWYVSEDFNALVQAKKLCPTKKILFTEGCIEGGLKLGSVTTGERYARNIIGDFSHGCIGYIDWNLCLNKMGGPNHVGNYCDAPMIIDYQTDKQLIINSSYYYIGHFSKYIKPGSVRIDSNHHSRLQVISFKKDNEIIIVICNSEGSDVEYTLLIDNNQLAGKINKHTIQTWCIKK